MSSKGVHVQPGGFTVPQTPKAIGAWGSARENFARWVITGIALGCLIVVFTLSMFWRPEFARDILLVISTTIGFVAGREFSARQ